MPSTQVTTPYAALLLRLSLGTIMLAHGAWLKLGVFGLAKDHGLLRLDRLAALSWVRLSPSVRPPMRCRPRHGRPGAPGGSAEPAPSCSAPPRCTRATAGSSQRLRAGGSSLPS